MLHITQWDTFICPNWRHFFLCCKKIIAMSISEHLCNLKFSHFLWRRRKAETESDNTHDIAGIEFFCHICFMAVPHDGNYIHSVFFSQTQITRCYQCFIFNSRSVDQKPEKSPQWKFNTFFHTEFWGLWFLRVKGYFMHGWSEGSDVKLTASVVYLGTTLFLSTCYSILAVMKWDLHRFS